MKIGILILLLGSSIALAENSEREACFLMKNKEMEMNIISSNIANANTTKTPEGGPYKEQRFVCKEKVCAIVSYQKTIVKHLPGHPDANAEGDVKFPDISIEKEMQAMIDARGIYEQASRNCKDKNVM